MHATSLFFRIRRVMGLFSLALLALPLFVPVLIFGAGASEAQATGLSATPHLSLLGAALIAALVGLPWAIGAAVRIAVD